MKHGDAHKGLRALRQDQQKEDAPVAARAQESSGNAVSKDYPASGICSIQ